MLRFDYGTTSGFDENPKSFASDQLGNLVTLRQILERGDRSEVYDLDEPPPTPSRLNVIAQYVYLGFEHILPLGLDHVLFVLSLFYSTPHGGLYLRRSPRLPLLTPLHWDCRPTAS